MSSGTSIEWTDATFNPWRGCTKVSPGCANCYAEKLSKRNPSVLGIWGDDGMRAIGSEAYWRQPLAWDRAAQKAGVRKRVFCASLADVFEDRPELAEPRDRLHALIALTPHLDWQLLTKRPDRMADYYQADDVYHRVLHQADHYWRAKHPRLVGIGIGHPADQRNRWAGTSVENQKAADERIPHLLRTPARVRFLSCEPLLGPLNLHLALCKHAHAGAPEQRYGGWCTPKGELHWVIVGGESGPNSRPMNPEWARSIRDQCWAANVSFFFKQWGEWRECQWRGGKYAITTVWDRQRPTKIIYADGRSFDYNSNWDGSDDGIAVERIGKKASGRMLDGMEWSEFPITHTPAAAKPEPRTDPS